MLLSTVIIVSSIISLLSACSVGQYPDPMLNGNCLTCSYNCLSCSNSTACNYCQYSYYINNNLCRSCPRDNGCLCNGVSVNCEGMDLEKIILVVAIPILVFIGVAFLAYFIREKCCRQRVLAGVPNNYDEFLANQRKNVVNHLGIITTMKAKWIYNQNQSIDQSEICSICLEQDCDLVIPCLHIYHSKCLANWVSRRTNCPTCKREQLSPMLKYCKRCRKNYIKTNLLELNQHLADFYILCSFCKEKSNKRMDSLCEMDMNETRL